MRVVRMAVAQSLDDLLLGVATGSSKDQRQSREDAKRGEEQVGGGLFYVRQSVVKTPGELVIGRHYLVDVGIDLCHY